MTRRATRIVFGFLSLAVAAGLTSCGIFAPTLVGDPVAGEAFYVLECQRCHATVELKVFSNLIVNDLGTLSPQMEGISLTDQEIANLQAYLATQ